MPITLYGLPGTRSTRVTWLLEELGVPYDFKVIELMKGEHKQPPHVARHAHGLVPAVDFGDGAMIESAAICLTLADRHADKGLAPAATAKERARYYEAIIYAISTLDETVLPIYFHKKVLPEAQRDPKVVAAKEPTWRTAAAILENRLGDRQYIAGDTFTAADVVVGYDLVLAAQVGLLEGHPKLLAYVQRIAARPAFKRAFPQ